MSVNQGVKIPAAMISAGLGDAYYTQGNAMLRMLQTLVQPNVKSMTLTAPPGSPADGDTYVIAASPTGAWTGQAKSIAYWSADPTVTTPAWEFYAPAKGWRVANQTDGLLYIYSGTAWVLVTPNMTNLAGGFVPTPPNDSTKYLDGSGAFSVPSGGAGGAMTKISEVILGSPAATISFAGIAGSYRNLKIALTGRSADTDGAVYLQFNADTAANYYEAYGYQGATTGNGIQSAVTVPTIAFVAISTAPANDAASTEITIFDYARTVWNKNATSLALRRDTTSSLFMFEQGFVWANTAAITGIVIGKGNAGNFATGTVATLYGVS